MTATGRNYIGADWVNADITVTTDADQTPLAPGYQVSRRHHGDGRRTVRFVTEAPVLNFFSVQSARYEIARQMHNGVEMVVYPRRRARPERAADADGAGSGRWTTTRPISRPTSSARRGSSSSRLRLASPSPMPNTFAWSEGIGFIADSRSDETKIDYVTYVAAHEFAHQWWAHQIVGADMQGATLLSETLAQYSALMVMEKMYGPDQIRRFLKFELDRYLRVARHRADRGTAAGPGREPAVHPLPQGRAGHVPAARPDRRGQRSTAPCASCCTRYAFKGAPYPRSTRPDRRCSGPRPRPTNRP